MNVRKEIDLFAADQDKPILLWLFERYHMESQWHHMANCNHHRYGDQSYMTNRVWSPSLLGLREYHFEKVTQALAFYANLDNWKEGESGIGMTPSDAEADYGSWARTVLAHIDAPRPTPPPITWRYCPIERKYVEIGSRKEVT